MVSPEAHGLLDQICMGASSIEDLTVNKTIGTTPNTHISVLYTHTEVNRLCVGVQGKKVVIVYKVLEEVSESIHHKGERCTIVSRREAWASLKYTKYPRLQVYIHTHIYMCLYVHIYMFLYMLYMYVYNYMYV
jgi:hypothetical protein